jgi:uncharacterized SAM-binding protein YcdF (DUF218 family)
MRSPLRLPQQRRWRFVVASALVVVLGWACAAFLVIVDPSINRPTHADAIVVLGGANVDGRLAKGLRLAREGYAGALLISTPGPNGYAIRQACAASIPHVTITCFSPSPKTTQGEAREIRAQAAARGWRTVLVVTSRYHVSRARLIIGRCFSGRLVMVTADSPSVQEWIYNIFYQTGAYAKALVNPGC